eukprot:COSAG02_NODE_3700_length_6367_cov_3.868379_3_plen_512_part_00
MGGPRTRTATDKAYEQWIRKEAPIVLPEKGATITERAAVPPPQKLLSKRTGHTPRRATGKLARIPITVVPNRRLQPSPQPLQPWSETELLTDWAHEVESKALDYYSDPAGKVVLKAGIAAQVQPEQGSRYFVLRQVDDAATLDVFAPHAWMTQAPARAQLPLLHAEVRRSGRRLDVKVHLAVHPDGGTVAFECETLQDSKQWDDAIRNAAAASETAVSREIVAQHADREVEQRRQRAEAAVRLEQETEEIRARQLADEVARTSAAANVAHATLGATAVATQELIERHCVRARRPPPVRMNADSRYQQVGDLAGHCSIRVDAAEARGAIADLRAAYHLRASRKQMQEDQRRKRHAPRENIQARQKQREAAERRHRRAQELRKKNDRLKCDLESERINDPVERVNRWGPCRNGDACVLPECRYSHPREIERKKAAVQQAKRAHEEVRSSKWKAEHLQRRPAADFRIGLKLGLKKPLMLPRSQDRIDPAEAQRAIAKLKAIYHPRRPLHNPSLL